MKKLFTLALVLAAFNFLLSGCGGHQADSVRAVEAVAATSHQKTKQAQRMNELMVKSRLLSSVDPTADYVIGPEDLLEIEVLQADDLKKEVRVNYRGFIGLPVIGQVKAQGLTPGQLEKELTQRLEKYLNDPFVTVYIKEYKSRKIAVTGAVNKPQVYSVVGQKYLLDMIFMAEGLKEAGRMAYIFRPVNKEDVNLSDTETIVVDLQELLDKGDRSLNVPVFSGDVVHIPHGGSIYVDGAVKKRGMYKITGKTTVVQAIAMAEGLTFVSDSADIRILRDAGAGARQVIIADYEKAQMDTKSDFEIQDNDIIIVGKSGLKAALDGFFTMIRGAINIGGASGSVAVSPPVIVNP
jgi:polysaccharide biosynthesis/export protein